MFVKRILFQFKLADVARDLCHSKCMRVIAQNRPVSDFINIRYFFYKDVGKKFVGRKNVVFGHP